MTKILSLDTSNEACSAAILDGSVCLHAFEVCPRKQSSRILPMIDALLKQASLTLTCLDAIAVSQGPGSFTGVRLGLSVAQGLAFGANRPVVPISTLKALAFQAKKRHSAPVDAIVVAMDARMDEVYYALFDAKSLEPIGEEQVVKPADIAPLPEALYAQKIIACGNGFELYQNLLLSRFEINFEAVYSEVVPEAQSIAHLAEKAFLSNQALHALEAKPVYIRNQVVQSAV